MLLGTQLILAGFLGELIIRHSTDRNHYEISEEIIDEGRPAIAARQEANVLDTLPQQQPVKQEVHIDEEL